MKILLLLIFPLLLFAEVSTNNQAQGLLTIFNTAKSAWSAAIIPFSVRLFWLLVIIDWVWTFAMLLLKGTDFSELVTTLIQKVIIIGFFLAMFQYTTWLDTIPQSFGQLADTINALPQKITPDTILEQGFIIVDIIWKGTSWFSNPGDSIGLMIAGLVILFAFIIMTATFFSVIVKLYLLIVGAYIVLALGGLSYTRTIGSNAIIAVFKTGLELFFIKLILGFSLNTITTMAANVGNENNSIMAMIGISFLIASLVSMVSGLVDTLTNGTLGTNGNLASNTKSAMMGAGTGAVGGAMASVAQVQNANSSSGSGSDSEDANSSDSGNFMSSTKKAAQTAGALTMGAGVGAVSGAIKGAMGFSSYHSGQKSGAVAGRLFSSNNTQESEENQITTSQSQTSNEENSNTEQSNDDFISGTIGGESTNDSTEEKSDNSNYISGIPRSSNND